MVYGQVIIGPAGSGKSTYCNGMQQFYTLIGGKIPLSVLKLCFRTRTKSVRCQSRPSE